MKDTLYQLSYRTVFGEYTKPRSEPGLLVVYSNLVGEVGLEPTVLLATDLQSAGLTNYPNTPKFGDLRGI